MRKHLEHLESVVHGQFQKRATAGETRDKSVSSIEWDDRPEEMILLSFVYSVASFVK